MPSFKSTRTAAAQVISKLLSDEQIESAIKYISPRLRVKATYKGKHKNRKRDYMREIMVTIGPPNYLERLFVKACKKAGEKFPVRKIQLRRSRIK